MIKIIEKPMPRDKYSIKCPFPITDLQYIVVHNTGNTASAEDEIAYMQRNDNEVSYHFAVDDICAILGSPLDRCTWQASDGGYGKGNRNSISIEICYSKDYTSNRYTKAEENCTYLVAQLLHDHWGKCDIHRVKRHYDFANDKKKCPHRMFEANSWEKFLDRIEQKYKEMYEEEEPMTTAERKEFDELKKGYEELKKIVDKYEKGKVYDNAAIRWGYIDGNLPSWAKPTIQKLVKKGFLKGNEKGSLELSYDLLRTLVLNDRAGFYD